MYDTVSKLEVIQNQLDEKMNKTYQIQTFINLCNKVEKEDNQEINTLISTTYELLHRLNQDETVGKKDYKRSFSHLQKEVRKVFGYTAKGQLQSEYTGIGIALGVAFGAGFAGINAAFVGIGLPIGLAIGASIGAQKEKQAEKNGTLY